jgi:tetratricopeptide (TPR) repeat protein
MAGKKFGLVIGNNYLNSGKELKFAVADAIKMKEILENKDICNFDNVALLINKTSRDALTELEKLFKNTHQNDLVFIYFSGHGTKDFANNLYLLFEDSNEEFLLASSLSFDLINKCRKYPQAQKASVIIVLDCCYSAAAGMKDTDVSDTLAGYCSAGTIILTSTGATGSSKAMEDDKLEHSVFTYYLIEGLEKGYADKDGDGYISIDDLYNYAFGMTNKRGLQSPKKEGSIEGNVFIGKNPLKIKEREFELKKNRLLDEFGAQLPSDILGECQATLRKYYKSPSLMDKGDKIILGHLETLLKDNLSTEKRDDLIQNCIEAVQHLKGVSITPSPFQKKCLTQETGWLPKQREESGKKQSEEEQVLKIKQREEQERKHREEDERVRREKEKYKIKVSEEPNSINFEGDNRTQETIKVTPSSNKVSQSDKKILIGVGVGIILGILIMAITIHNIDPPNVSELVNESATNNTMGKYVEALMVSNEAIKMDPNNVYAWNNKTYALYGLGKYDEALIACNKAIELDPNSAHAWNNKGCALDGLGRYNESIQAYNKVLELDPNNMNVWIEKGNALHSLGRYDEATACFNKAAELNMK